MNRCKGFLHRISQVKIVITSENKQPMIVFLFGPHFVREQLKKWRRRPSLKNDGEAEYIKNTC